MAERWQKPGARKAGIEIGGKVEGKLYHWDFLPLGKKIENMESLLSAIKNPPKRKGEFGFLSLAKEGELASIRGQLEKRVLEEKGSLEEMRGVFSRWQVGLGRIGVRPEDISHPHGTRWWYHEGQDLLMFSSPAMAKWYDENVRKKNLQPSHWAPDEELVRAINAKRVFGLGRIHTAYTPGVANIKLIQPIVFYKSLGGGLGKTGTAKEAPLAHSDLLLLYGHLKEAEKLGAIKVSVHAELPTVLRGKDPGYLKIYARLAKVSQPLGREEKMTRAVFMRRHKSAQRQHRL